jgi:hypothetical protein
MRVCNVFETLMAPDSIDEQLNLRLVQHLATAANIYDLKGCAPGLSLDAFAVRRVLVLGNCRARERSGGNGPVELRFKQPGVLWDP